MDVNSWLVIALFVILIVLFLSGFPVALVLAGVGILFGFIGYFSDNLLPTNIAGSAAMNYIA